MTDLYCKWLKSPTDNNIHEFNNFAKKYNIMFMPLTVPLRPLKGVSIICPVLLGDIKYILILKINVSVCVCVCVCLF